MRDDLAGRRLSDPIPRSTEDVWHQIGRLAFGTGSKTQWVFRGMQSAGYPAVSSLVRRMKVAGQTIDEAAVRAAESALIDDAPAWGVGTEFFGFWHDGLRKFRPVVGLAIV